MVKLYAAFDGNPYDPTSITLEVLFTDCGLCADQYDTQTVHVKDFTLDDVGLKIDELTKQFHQRFPGTSTKVISRVGECNHENV